MAKLYLDVAISWLISLISSVLAIYCFVSDEAWGWTVAFIILAIWNGCYGVADNRKLCKKREELKNDRV